MRPPANECCKYPQLWVYSSLLGPDSLKCGNRLGRVAGASNPPKYSRSSPGLVSVAATGYLNQTVIGGPTGTFWNRKCQFKRPNERITTHAD